jgi:ribosomal protein S21
MATVNDFRGNRNIEDMIKKFRRECDDEGILNELKKRRYFHKDSRLKHERNKKAKHKIKINEKSSGY